MKFRRWIGAGSAVVLGLGLGLQPTAAQASAGDASLVIGTWVRANDIGCGEPAWRAAARTKNLPADGRTRAVRLSQSGKAAGSTVKAYRSSEGTYNASGWGTRKLKVSLSVRLSATANPSRICWVNSFVGKAEIYTVRMSAPKKSWMVVRSRGAKQGSAEANIGVQGPTTATSAWVAPGKPVTRLVPKGEYTLGSRVKPSMSVPARTTSTRTASASIVGTVALYPIGTLRARSGNGKSFVKPGHRDCSKNRVKVGLTAAARTKARKITFTVDGKKRFTLTGAKLKQTSVFVGRIPKKTAGTIKANIVLKSGAKKTTKSTSWPCA